MKLHVPKLALALLVVGAYCAAAISYGPTMDHAANLAEAISEANKHLGHFGRFGKLVKIEPWHHDLVTYNNVVVQLQKPDTRFAYVAQSGGSDIYAMDWNLANEHGESDRVLLFGINGYTGEYAPFGYAKYVLNGNEHSKQMFWEHAQRLRMTRKGKVLHDTYGFVPQMIPPTRAS